MDIEKFFDTVDHKWLMSVRNLVKLKEVFEDVYSTKNDQI